MQTLADHGELDTALRTTVPVTSSPPLEGAERQPGPDSVLLPSSSRARSNSVTFLTTRTRTPALRHRNPATRARLDIPGYSSSSRARAGIPSLCVTF